MFGKRLINHTMESAIQLRPALEIEFQGDKHQTLIVMRTRGEETREGVAMENVPYFKRYTKKEVFNLNIELL